MEYNSSKEKDFVVDIESTRISSQEHISNEPLAHKSRRKKLLNKLTSGVLGYNRSCEGESIIDSDGNLGPPSEDSKENLQVLIDECPGGKSEDRIPLVEKKQKCMNSTKASKPPRPPKAPLLNASDLKLVKEISELAMKKRVRTERMKALKKAKAAKSSSSSSSSCNTTLLAMVITIIFSLIIILQGFSSRKSLTGMLEGSPAPAAGTNDLISVQFFNSRMSTDGIAPSSASPSTMEQLSGSGFRSPG